MSSRNFWILVPSLSLPLMGLGVGAHPLFIAPLRVKTEVIHQQIRDTQKEINGLFSEFPDLPGLQVEREKEESQAVELSKRLSRLEEGVLKYSEFLSLIRARGGKIDSIREETQGPYSYHRLLVKSKASPQEWMELLDSLEKSSSYLRVRSLRIGTGKPGVSEVVEEELELETVAKFSSRVAEKNKR